MKYIALLRGINVGGNHKVEMSRLKKVFEKLEVSDIKTYINSGNVIFGASEKDESKLCKNIESAIEKEFGFAVPTLLRSFEEIDKVLSKIPRAWVNDSTMRCDIMFLWPDIDKAGIENLVPKPKNFEDFIYVQGALVWRVDRAHVRPGAGPKLIGTSIYKQMTIRNINTVRKIYELMKD